MDRKIDILGFCVCGAYCFPFSSYYMLDLSFIHGVRTFLYYVTLSTNNKKFSSKISRLQMDSKFSVHTKTQK